MFDTKNIPNMDLEGTSDVYITAYVDDKDKKSTDTHYRCQDGEASFNYRMLFNVPAPRPNYELVIQAWDRDLFKSNDHICEWNFDMTKLFECVRLSQQQIQLTRSFVNYSMKNDKCVKDLEFNDDGTFWLTTRKEGKLIKVRLDLRIFPSELS